MASSARRPVRLWQIVPDQPPLSPTKADISDDPDNNNKGDRGSACSPTTTSRAGVGRTACRADRGSPIVEPCDVAFLGPYTFVVADSEGHRLIVADIERNVCSVIGEGQVWPNGVDVTIDGKILVTDRRKKGVAVYDAERGDRLWVWAPGEDVLRRPHGVATTPRGEAVVTDTDRCQVCVFSVRDGPTTRPIRKFGSRGDQLQQLRLPFYCAYDSRRDEILVADNMNYCVKIFDGGRSTSSSSGRKDSGANGPFLRKIGSGNAFGQRQFQCPYGVTVDSNSGNVLVADYDTHRVFEFDGSTGSFVRYPLTGSDGCRSPCGLAVGRDCGTLVVTESAGGGTADQLPSGVQSPAVSAGTGNAPWPANIKAYALHGDGAQVEAGTNASVVVWARKTESAV